MDLPTPDDIRHMRSAVECARLSVDEPDAAQPKPKVGAVVVKDGMVLATAYRGETGEGDHAEFGALEKKLAGVDLSGATVYTTLEPCTKRSNRKLPCSTWLIDRGITTVWIGQYDPNPVVHRIGWKRLVDADIVCRDFVLPLREEIEAMNTPFVDQFRRGEGDAGEGTFDHHQLDGRFLVYTDSAGAFWTAWTECSDTCVYAVDDEHLVAKAKGATGFDQIDDPSAYEFERDSWSIDIGGIAIFRNSHAYLLAQVLGVQEMDRGADGNSVTIRWEARPDRSEDIARLLAETLVT